MGGQPMGDIHGRGYPMEGDTQWVISMGGVTQWGGGGVTQWVTSMGGVNQWETPKGQSWEGSPNG